MVAGLLAPLLFYDPRPLGGEVRAALFPGPDAASMFWVFVAYTFVIHVPFEELALPEIVEPINLETHALFDPE